MSPSLKNKKFATACAVCALVIGVTAYFTREPAAEPGGETGATSASPAAGVSVSRAGVANLVKAAELDPAKQKKIWDAEHITFLIETHLCKAFAAEMIERKWSRFPEWFRSDFEGSVLAGKLRETKRQGVVGEREVSSDEGSRPVDAAGLGGYLMGGLKEFAKVDRARLRILHIKSVDAAETVWETHMLLVAVGTTEKGEPIQSKSEHDVSFVVADKESFKEEIQEKATISRWNVRSEKLRMSGKVLFEEVTERSGLTDLPINDNWVVPRGATQQYRFKMAVADFDLDGFLDVAAAPDTLEPVLLRSINGERFEFVADKMGLEPFDFDEDGFMSLIAAWLDFNNDGYPDLIMGSRLYRNEAGKRFVDVTAKSGLKIRRDPNGCVVADYDCDGLLDLYILNQVPKEENLDANMPWVGDTEHGAENQLWRNLGDGRFEDVTKAAGVGGGRRESFAGAWIFYDEDHYPDLYVANDFGENVLFRNQGDGTFEDATVNSGAGDYATSMGVSAGDLNNDGKPEIYVANMYSKMGRRIIAYVEKADYPEGIYEQILGSCAGNRLYVSAGQGKRYVEQGEEMGVDAVGWAYAPAMVDLDNDGWLDLYATTGFMSFDRHKPDG